MRQEGGDPVERIAFVVQGGRASGALVVRGGAMPMLREPDAERAWCASVVASRWQK